MMLRKVERKGGDAADVEKGCELVGNWLIKEVR